MSGASADDIDRQARRWAVRLAGGKVPPRELARFRRWRDADPKHAEAYQEVAAIMAAASGLEHLAPFISLRPDIAATAGLRRPRLGRARGGALRRGGLAAAAAAAAAVAALHVGLVPVSTAYATPAAETRNITLRSGDQVILGAESELRVRYQLGRETVELRRGQAFFDVRGDGRLRVRAGETALEPEDAAFDVVAASPRRLRIAVLRGTVRVSGAAAGDLQGGQEAVLGGPSPVLRTSAEPTAGNWRTGRLQYAEASLVDVLADADRYLPGRVRVVSGLEAHRVTAAFQADQARAFVLHLPEVLPVTVVEEPSGDLRVAPSGG